MPQSFQYKLWFMSNTRFYSVTVKTVTLELDVLRNQIGMWIKENSFLKIEEKYHYFSSK